MANSLPSLAVTAASKAYRAGAGAAGAAAAEEQLQHMFTGVGQRLQELERLLTRDTCARVLSLVWCAAESILSLGLLHAGSR